MTGRVRAILTLTLALALIAISGSQQSALAAGNETILFLHHSTGSGVYYGGNVSGWFDDYNGDHGTSYVITERTYPDSPYPWQNYPYDYWYLWVHGECDSSSPNTECMNTLTQAYNVVIYKHCFPGADVVADDSNPNVASPVQTLANYKLQYRALRTMMDSYPNTIFIVWTLVPLHRLDTTAANAARAKQFADWVKSDFLTEDGKTHKNIFIFDFWGLAAGTDNFLKYEYESAHTGTPGNVDSHPNALANQTIGPLFAQRIVDAINAFSTSKPPARPGALNVN